MSKKKKDGEKAPPKISVITSKKRPKDRQKVIGDFHEILDAFDGLEIDGYVIYVWGKETEEDGFSDGLAVQRGSYNPYLLPDLVKNALTRWL